VKSLLNALQEGRLVELPETEKGKALEYLAHLLEAVPDLSGISELYEAMMEREKAQNTGIGLGVGCPHVRASGEGGVFCAVGWSPAGIDYGAADGKKVHLVVMYYIPDAQKNVYLKEISALAGAIQRGGGIAPIASAGDIAAVRERLLDWVLAAIEAAAPDPKARMIRLEARQAAVEAAPTGARGQVQVVPALIVALDKAQHVVLCQNPELASALEKAEAGGKIRQQDQFELVGYRMVFQSATSYAAGRALYQYLGIKLS